MAIQDKYKKQQTKEIELTPEEIANIDWADDDSSSSQALNNIDTNSPEFENYNPNLEIQQPQEEMPQVQKNVDAFGTGGINMLGLRAPITGALTAGAGLVGKALGKNDKSFWENYQAGKDFVNQQNEQAKLDNPTAYYAGYTATGIPLALAGFKKFGGNEIMGKALTKGKETAAILTDQLPIKETLKTVAKKIGSKGTKKAITSYLAYKGLDTLADKLFESKGNNYYGGNDGTNY